MNGIALPPVTLSGTYTRGQTELLWLAVLFIGGGTLLLLVLLGADRAVGIKPHTYGMRFELAAAGLGLWLFTIWMWWIRKKGRFDPFELPVWISLNVYLQVVINVWLQRDRVTYVTWLQDNYASTIPMAVLLFLVSLTALWTGYIWTSSRLAKQPLKSGPFTTGPMRVNVVMSIWVAGWLIRVLFVLAGIGTYLGTGTGSSLAWLNYLEFVNIVTHTATVVLVFHHFQRPTMLGRLWIALIVVSDISMALVVGSKSFALTLLWLMIYIYYATGRLPKRLLVMGASVVILLVPVINSYRVSLHNLDTGKGVALTMRLLALETALIDSVEQSLARSFEITSDTFRGRQGSMLDLTASALYLHPNKYPFVGGEMLADFLPRLIPRVLWPSKPVARSQLYMITSTYGGSTSEHSFSEIGLAADSYRAGGWVFVVVWFGLMGAFGAWLYHQGPVRHSLAGTAFYIILLTQLLAYEGTIAITLINLIQFGVLLWLIMIWVMFEPSEVSTRTNNLSSVIVTYNRNTGRAAPK